MSPIMGIRSRLLLVVLSVATLSVALTALVVQRITSDQLTEQVVNDREVVNSINTTLNEFALTARSWDEAKEIVADLAEQHEVRVALVDLDGDILLDSSPLLDGENRPLPVFESGFIDPSIDAFDIEIPPEVEAEWLADEEFGRCLSNRGIDRLLLEQGRLDDPRVDARFFDQSVLCWEEAYAEILVNDPDYDGSYAEDDWSQSDSWALEPALLFLGDPGEPGNVLESSIDYRMALSVLAIGTVAILATYLFARRILAPISALTHAAHEVAAGGRPEPVPVQGDNELSELAVAFNSMGNTLRKEEESRRRLTTDIAHELRSPLQNIRGTLEAAQDGVRELDLDLIGSVHEDALILQHLVDDLQVLALADAAILHMNNESVSVEDLLQTTIRSHTDRASEAGIELSRTDDGDRTVRLVGDSMRLGQVLSNLVDNALRHTADGGRVQLRTSTFVREGQAIVRIAVSDTGEGIPEAFLPHVFDRFSRADPSRTRGTGGSGVGLAISQKLVEAHSGNIIVSSKIGVGTTFTIELPTEP